MEILLGLPSVYEVQSCVVTFVVNKCAVFVTEYSKKGVIDVWALIDNTKSGTKVIFEATVKRGDKIKKLAGKTFIIP